MIITLKVSLGTYWSAEIEFSDLSTLEDVHIAIQDAVDFDNDHLYEFFVARNEHARNKTRYVDADGDGNIYEARLCDIFPLPAKQQLFYLFDYGDCWIFKVSKTRKSPFEPVDGVDYPRVIKETGEKPVQYESEDEY